MTAAPPPQLPPGGPALAALTRRELLRFARQPSRIAAALGTPLLVWVFFGSGFTQSFAPRTADAAPAATSYAAYLLPGMASLAVLFSSIFAAISLIEDRHSGFLQSVLVSPAPRWSIAGSKVLGSTLIAAAQAFCLLLPAPLLNLASPAGLPLALIAVVVIAVLISGLGLAAAWRIDSIPGFHGLMNTALMPMWLLSGAIFPAAGAAAWLRWLMLLNPLYWPTAALRQSLHPAWQNELAGPAVVWSLTILVGAAGFAFAWATLGRRPA